MSIQISRAVNFLVDGDGSATSITIDLREQLETKDVVGGYSPSGAENGVFKSVRSGTTISVTSITVSQFVATVNLASAPASDPQFGYNLSFNLLFEGEK